MSGPQTLSAPQARQLKKALPRGHFLYRPRTEVHKILPFARTLYNAFRDLERIHKIQSKPSKTQPGLKSLSPAKGNVITPQKSYDDQIHAAKLRLKSYKDALISAPAGFALLAGKTVKSETVKSKIKGAEKHLSGLKKKRGVIQTSAIPKDKGSKKEDGPKPDPTPSPSYLRRLERRRLLREVAALQKQAESVVSVPPPVTTEPVGHFNLLQSGASFATNLVLPEAGTQFQFQSPSMGLVRISRAKVTSKKAALDLTPETGGAPVRLGVLEKGIHGWSLAVASCPSMDAAFLLGALHTSPETLPGDFSLTVAR